ncbi:hypothetical protein RHMOL_Rhmol07G0264300 [Rhododendron molle]|uniref:Uncharacterized protein n=1 Tax=Rhododendron molle TaxID=49168 RepID=A0ACC0N5E0_RHOML|nr:hypothetical protein RHMOL_Rhmol07G0264300 [Rhododendron molle]
MRQILRPWIVLLLSIHHAVVLSVTLEPSLDDDYLAPADPLSTPWSRGYIASGVVVALVILCYGLALLIGVVLALVVLCYGLARLKGDAVVPDQTLTIDRNIVYSEVKGLEPDDASLECAVCLSEFGKAEKLRLLPVCNHVFHPGCVDQWLSAHATCPLCRSNLAPEHDESRQTRYFTFLSHDPAEPEPAALVGRSDTTFERVRCPRKGYRSGSGSGSRGISRLGFLATSPQEVVVVDGGEEVTAVAPRSLECVTVPLRQLVWESGERNKEDVEGGVRSLRLDDNGVV